MPARDGRFRAVALAAVAAAVALGPARAAAPPLAALSDEFTDASSLQSWNVTTGDAQGTRTTRYDVATTDPGALTIDTGRSWWVDGTHAFYLWKDVTGDFVATARLRVTGRTSPSPTANWSLSGLLVRAPTSDTGNENWIGFTVGRVAGKSVFERKSTRHSVSRLVLDAAPEGWLELRVARVGPAYALLLRPDGGRWRAVWWYWRSDLPRTLEVGVDAQSGFDDADGDLVAHVDYVRFRATRIPPKVRARFVAGRVAPTKLLKYLTGA